MRIALGVEYDGQGFSGWESQVGRDTVQRRLEGALSRVADRPVRTVCAGRTDAGVHACGQVAHFDTEAPRPMRGWVFGANSHLPPAVSVLWAERVPEAFHARYSALARRYRYVILNRPVRPAVLAGRVGWEYRPLDTEPMREGAACLLGEHDFSSFRAADCQARTATRRITELDVHRRGVFVLIEVTANAFLQHMVRNLVGALVEVGNGKRDPGWMRRLLAARDRTQGGVTASPAGLYLMSVEYPETFELPRVSPLEGLW